jgi:NDP-sugar pyrophosphorylase family protein
MKAMIFAAGLGTRLRPLTDDRPKALVEVGGVSLLEINIRRLMHFGVNEIVINTHHFAEKIAAFLASKNNFGIRIELSHEVEKPLETGGGLKKAAWFFDDGLPFLVCNADILCDIDLLKLYTTHCQSDALATYAIQQRDTSRYMLHDADLRLCGWANVKTKAIKIARAAAELQMYSFSCFHVVDPKIFETAPQTDYFSMIDWYLAIADKHKIMGVRHDADVWCDVGKIETLPEAEAVAELLMNS